MKRILAVLAMTAVFGFAVAQTLIFGQSGEPVTLDTGQDGNSLTPAIQSVEQLVGFKRGTAEIEPLLALSWEANASADQWTFQLREGVMFHDGTPFNAEAVKYNFDRWNNLDHPFSFVEEGNDFTSFTYVFGGYHGDDGYLIDTVDAVDEYTVRFNLTQSVGYFPQQVAASYFGLHSPAAIEEAGITYGHPGSGIVGTGPFVFREWLEGNRITFDRNDNYWGEAAGVEELVFRGIESATTRLAELEAGSIDIAVNLSPESYDVVAGSEAIKVVSAEADMVLGYLGMHQGNKPFDDVRVRQAFAYAIDKDAIVEAFYGELAQVANEFIPPGLPGRLNNEPYPYDPEKAVELLAEAGFPDGFDTEFWYMPVSRPYYPAPKDVAEAVASYLGDVGIRAELKTEDWGVYLDDYLQGKFPMYMLGWSADFADPDNFISSFFNRANAPGFGYENEELFTLINEAQSAGSLEERVVLYQQIEQIIYDDLPALPFVNPRTLNAVQNNIDGFYPNPLGSVVPLWSVTKN